MAEEDSWISRDNVSDIVDFDDENSGLLPTTNDLVSNWPTNSESDASSARKVRKKSSRHGRLPKVLRSVEPTGSRIKLSETTDHRRGSESSSKYKELPPIPADANFASTLRSVPMNFQASSADAVPFKEPYVPLEYQEGETSSSSVRASEGRRRSRSKQSRRKKSTDEATSLDEGSESIPLKEPYEYQEGETSSSSVRASEGRRRSRSKQSRRKKSTDEATSLDDGSESRSHRRASRTKSPSSSRRTSTDPQREIRTGKNAHEQKPPTAPRRHSIADDSIQEYEVRDGEQGQFEERRDEIVQRRHSDSQVEKRRRRRHISGGENEYQQYQAASSEELTSGGFSQHHRRRRSKRSRSRSESYLNDNPSRIQENDEEEASEQIHIESRNDDKRRTSRSSRVQNVNSAIVVKSPGNEKELAVDPNDLISASAGLASLDSDALHAESHIGMHRHTAMLSTESLTLTGHQLGGIKSIIYVEDGTRFRKRDQTKIKDEAAAEAAATAIAPPQDLRTHDMQLIAVIHDVEHLVLQILYGFQGLLGGISLLLLVLFQLSSPSATADVQLFLQYYSPHSSTMYKLYSVVSTLALIGALDSSVVRRAVQFGNEYMLTTTVVHAERSAEVDRGKFTYQGPVQSESGIVAGIGRGSIRKLGMEAVFGTTEGEWNSWARKAKVVVWLRLIASFVAFLSCVLMTHVDARISESDTTPGGGLYGTPGWYISSSVVETSTVSSDVKEWFALNCTRGVAGVLAWMFACWESRLQQAVLLASK